MRRYLIVGVFTVLLSLVGDDTFAQEAKKSPPPNPVAVNAPHDPRNARPIELSPKQVELVRQVNGYFNQLTILKGTFTQTSADNKRQRGKFHIMRPGRFRFELLYGGFCARFVPCDEDNARAHPREHKDRGFANAGGRAAGDIRAGSQ